MSQKVTVITILYLLYVNISESARILVVVPTPSISHQVPFRPLTQELAKRGHEVVVITTDPAFPKRETPANLTEIDVHDSYDIWQKIFKYVTGKGNDITNQFAIFYGLMTDIVEDQFKHPEIAKLIYEKQKFDLLILEAWVRPILVYAHVFKAPVIQMSSFGRVLYNYEEIGAPVHPLLYPRLGRQRLYNLTLWEKIVEMYNEYQILSVVTSNEKADNEMIKRNFGANVPPINELANSIDILMLNVHPIWEGNNPVPPGVVYVWGLHKTPKQLMPEDLKSHIESSKHGVIYMSFGTNTKPSGMPAEMIKIFIKVFSQLPYNVLWKWDKDELPGKPQNIRIQKWFPQTEILKHPNVKLFITQGGLQSTDEAINAELPMIGIPMLGDQWYNVEKFVYHGIGVKILPELITEEEFKNAIETVIRDTSYRNNIKKLKILMNDQPQSALQRAVWWTEYVLRHGGARHLRAPAANISWAQYLELELVLTLLTIVVLVLIISIGIIYCTCKWFNSRSSKEKTL